MVWSHGCYSPYENRTASGRLLLPVLLAISLLSSSREDIERSGNSMEIIAPGEWHDALDLLEKEKGIVLLLGATNAGKSTLAKFLISHLCRRRLRVGLVDADIGQSVLGPPTTIGVAVFEPPLDRMKVLSSDIFFVGSTTPEGNLPLHLKGVKGMVDRAISNGAEVIIVDTTGFILGEAGKEFKRKKIDLLMPRFILALQKSGEIEDLLQVYEGKPGFRVYRLPVPERLLSRSREERTAYRAAKFKEYFKEARIRTLSTLGIELEGKIVDSAGLSIPPEWALAIRGLLIGLSNFRGDTLALAMIASYDDEERTLKVLTPLKELKNVKSIRLSSLRLSPSYEEERF